MPLCSTDVTPLHHYYGLMPPDFEGHFLPSSFIGFYSPLLSGFRCSLRPSLWLATLAPICDPPAIPSPTVGGLGTPVVQATGAATKKNSLVTATGSVSTEERLLASFFLRAVLTMVPGESAWPLFGPPAYLFPWRLLTLGHFLPPSPSFIPPGNSSRAHVGVSGRDCQPSIRAGTSPASSITEFGLVY